jgi:hypothetical protein
MLTHVPFPSILQFFFSRTPKCHGSCFWGYEYPSMSIPDFEDIWPPLHFHPQNILIPSSNSLVYWYNAMKRADTQCSADGHVITYSCRIGQGTSNLTGITNNEGKPANQGFLYNSVAETRVAFWRQSSENATTNTLHYLLPHPPHCCQHYQKPTHLPQSFTFTNCSRQRSDL